MKKIAIITGATGGIGSVFIEKILNEDLDEVWAVARNKSKLDNLCTKYGDKVIPISINLTDTDELYKLEQKISDENAEIKYLINNAGTAKMAKSTEISDKQISDSIDISCKCPVILINLCIKHMKKGDKILNISSAASFQPDPYINLYASSKVFLRSYSRALNMELKDTGITVTAVCPSWVDTDMLIKEINGKKVEFPGIVTAQNVVDKAIKDAKKGKDMSVCSLYVKCQHVFVKLMPQKFIMKKWLKSINKYIN